MVYARHLELGEGVSRGRQRYLTRTDLKYFANAINIEGNREFNPIPDRTQYDGFPFCGFSDAAR